MKKEVYNHIEESVYRKNLLMFIQTFEEVLFDYSFESYKLPALNSHYLCFDLLTAKYNMDNKSITEGNFIPLSEEFEEMLETDIVLRDVLQITDIMLKKRDKLGIIIDYSKGDNKSKIGKYTEAAEYVLEFVTAEDIYLTTILDMLVDTVFTEESDYFSWQKIYLLARTLATELVNGGYSQEYIGQELKNMFMDMHKTVKCEKSELIDFLNIFTFERKRYIVKLGVNAAAASFLSYINIVKVEKPNNELIRALNLKHKGDRIVEIEVEAVDEYKACEKAYEKINTIVSLHRINQHHKPVFIKKYAQICEIDEDSIVLSNKTIKTSKNVLLQANNESQLQSYIFDEQLLNSVKSPEAFFRAVSLHNTALDSKEATNQLLGLWTAVETLVGFRAGDEDKINVICDILGSILNRTYIYSHIEQLYKDIVAVLGKSVDDVFNNIEGEEKKVIKLAKILALKKEYGSLYEKLDEYPILQYRMDYFSNYIFKNSESVYNELKRHRRRIRWQIMRIYRNRNMIVHNGEHMPYLNIILGNLHYYVDSMMEVLVEYYHLGVKNNKAIFFHLSKEEIKYWEVLGLDDKGKKLNITEITEDNFMQIIFNYYEGNLIKNLIEDALEKYKKESGGWSFISDEISDC